MYDRPYRGRNSGVLRKTPYTKYLRQHPTHPLRALCLSSVVEMGVPHMEIMSSLCVFVGVT